MRKGYLRQLLDLFKMCEDLEDRTGLALMYRLVKGLVLLNDANLFDELLRDDNVMDVVGALEYECLVEEFTREREEQEREEEALRKLEVEGVVTEDRTDNGAAAEPSGNAGSEGSDAAAQNAERIESGGEASTVATRATPKVCPPCLNLLSTARFEGQRGFQGGCAHSGRYNSGQDPSDVSNRVPEGRVCPGSSMMLRSVR